MKPEAAGHFRKATESLEDARVLLREKRHAACVSCSYYAMYHAAQAMLVEEGLDLGSHEAVKTKFGELLVVKKGVVRAEYGKMLKQGLEFRTDADYAVDARGDIESHLAEQQFENASRFLSMAQEFLEGEG